jgi:multiple sugar transport system permease protein
MIIRSSTRYWKRRSYQGAATPWLFSLPAILFLLAFLVTPFLLAVIYSFTNLRLLSPIPLRFVGLQNYIETFQDPTFFRALANTLVFVVVVVPAQTGLALFLAVLVNQKLLAVKAFRTIYFAPVVTVMAVAATIWRILYVPDGGFINGFLGAVSGGALHPNWLQSTSTALFAIIIMSIWQGVGFQMIVLLAGLQDIPAEMYEAANIDGASGWQQFRFVTIPQLRNPLLFVVTITTILAFGLFDQVYVMTQGGPLDSTRTLMLDLVDVGYGRQRIGLASAIAVIFFVMVLAINLVQRLLIREEAA